MIFYAKISNNEQRAKRKEQRNPGRSEKEKCNADPEKLTDRHFLAILSPYQVRILNNLNVR